MLKQDYTLEELAELSGMSIRTLRYYIQEGLLPGPDTRGKNASYSDQHVDLLKIITRLKNLRLTMNEIRDFLTATSPKDLEKFLRKLEKEAAGNKVEHYMLKPSMIENMGEPTTNKSAGQRSALEYIHDLQEKQNQIGRVMREQTQPDFLASIPAITPSQSSAEVWHRLSLAEGLELHYREPVSRSEQKKIDQLIVFINKLFNK